MAERRVPVMLTKIAREKGMVEGKGPRRKVKRERNPERVVLRNQEKSWIT